MYESSAEPAFRSDIKATGDGECWSHTNESWKFKQFGWRSWKQEGSYKPDCLIGNWNEERFDKNFISQLRPLPSQYGHYYETSHSTYYNANISPNQIHINKAKESLRTKITREKSWVFPVQQPKSDVTGSYVTTSMSDFRHPDQQRSN